MRILVDADACPVTWIAERVAMEEEIPLLLFCDTNHELSSPWGEVIVVSQGADAVDLKLMNSCRAGDIVITQDYGVAAMALGRKAHALHQSGKRYTNEVIDSLLFQRYAAARKRRSGRGRFHGHGPARRTEEDDRQFEAALRSLVRELRETE